MRRFRLDRYPVHEERSLFSLVENRTSYSYNSCELNMFETHRQAENVELTFDHFVVTSMIAGKKIMRLPKKESFDYLPGETLIVPPGEKLEIDFPEARSGNPTQCLALTISDDIIRHTIDELNDQHPKEQTWGSWNIDPSMLHFENNKELAETINRILRITFTEEGKAKNMMMELTLREMLIRLMQTQARTLFESSYEILASANSLAATVAYIRNNLSSKICLEKLAKISCMSRAGFFKKFKETMGETPAQFVMNERIKLAMHQLHTTDASITEVCFLCGFENLSHFITSFKNIVGKTPKTFKLEL